MDKFFILCNKNKETERLKNLEKIIDNSKININNIEFFCKCWSSDIKNYKNKDNFTEYDNNIFKNLNDAEISLFINHIEILKKIKTEYNEGNFLILESDIYVYNEDWRFNKFHLDEIIDFSKNLDNWDIINVGRSCIDVFQSHGYPKSNPIINNNDKYYKEDRLICIEALIWNYNSICKFLKLYEEYNIERNNIISDPIDVILDNLCITKKLNLYWKTPSLCMQGSGIQFPSWLRK